ncbi:MAG: hypothetical protein WC644_08800 [Ignavibacteria bacterium]
MKEIYKEMGDLLFALQKQAMTEQAETGERRRSIGCLWNVHRMFMGCSWDVHGMLK